MTSGRVLDALLSPSLKADRDRGKLIEVYTNRLLELNRQEVYAYLYDHAKEILKGLPTTDQKVRFVLGTWKTAPPEHWESWASSMPAKYDAGGLAAMTENLLGHLVTTSASLEPEACRSVLEHLPPLRPALKAFAEEVEAEDLSDTVWEALEQNEWWNGEDSTAIQVAMHELVRAIQHATPRLNKRSSVKDHPLREVRLRDILRAPLQEPWEVKGMSELAVDLSVESYAELWERIPEADAETQPALFAARVVARVNLEQRERGPNASRATVTTYVKEVVALFQLGTDYRSQFRQAAITLIDLQPRPYQLANLSIYLGMYPGEEVLSAVQRWAERSDRKDRADALTRMIRPLFNATDWVGALSQSDYTEAPVIRALSKALLEPGTKVKERVRMASMTRTLRIRTQSGRDKLADLIAALLTAKRPKEDLRVALVLCEGLGSEHQRQSKLQKAFVSYAKRHSHKFTPSEVRAIAGAGVVLNGTYLSKNALKQGEELIAEGVEKVRQLGKFFGLGSSE